MRASLEGHVNTLAQYSRDHSDHSARLNNFASTQRRVATCRECALWINGIDAVADEHGVVLEYYDGTDRRRIRGAEFKSVAWLKCRRHAPRDDTRYDHAVQQRQLNCCG